MSHATHEATPMTISPAVGEIIGRALMDEQFRQELFTNQDHALAGHALTPAEREVLKNIDPAALEAHVGKLSNDTAAKMAIYVVIKVKF